MSDKKQVKAPAAAAPTKKAAKKSSLKEIVTREYTIHLHKHLYGVTFKKRAPKAIKVIRKFAQDAMKTKEIRLDPSLNAHVWKNGIKSVPHRVRVRLARQYNDDEDAKDKLYTIVTPVIVSSFKGLETETVEE